MKLLLVGAGTSGAYIYQMLEFSGHDIVFIDKQEEAIQQLPESARSKAYLGDGTDPELLEKVRIQDMDVVAAITNSDEANLVISTLAKFEYGVPRVLARVNVPQSEWLFTPAMGVDVAVNSAQVISRLIVEEMDTTGSRIVAQINKSRYEIIEFEVQADSKFANKQVADLDIPDDSLIISVIKNKQLQVAKGHTLLEVGDRIMALVDEDRYQELQGIL